MSPLAIVLVGSAGYIAAAGLLLVRAFRHDDKVTDALAPLEVPGDDDLMAVADAVREEPVRIDDEVAACDLAMWELELEPQDGAL